MDQVRDHLNEIHEQALQEYEAQVWKKVWASFHILWTIINFFRTNKMSFDQTIFALL